MKAYKDFGSHYFLVFDGLPPIHMRPKIMFAKSLPRHTVELSEDEAAFVLVGFVEAAQRNGGDSVAIHHLKEIYMAKSKGFLAVNLAASPAVILHIFAFEKNALEDVAKSDNPVFGATIIGTEEEFNKLSVVQRCELARPLLTEKEAAETPDGEGLAAIGFKIAQRFKNPKPVKGTTEKAGGTKEKVPAAPRAKGVKTLIYDHFTANKDTAHMTVEEIMKQVDGTKASVTTAISDLRSPKYAGKQGTLNLVRVNGKYCVEGSALQAKAEADEKAADEKAALAKAETKAKADADKKAKADAKAKVDADAKAKTAETTKAGAGAPMSVG